MHNLDQLNAVGDRCGENVYLTANDDLSTDPEWLKGCEIDSDGGANGEKTGVIILTDKGNGVLDVFYFYFWAFNYGGVVTERHLGKFLQEMIFRIGMVWIVRSY